MKRIPFYVVDSFTDTPFQGNPAGVFIDDQGVLTADEMRQLAGEVHLESAFVLPPYPDDVGLADIRLRYFTGTTEVPLCGHDTIATAAVLRRLGRFRSGQWVRAATQVGIVPILLEETGTATMLQRPPQFDRPYSTVEIDPIEVAAALGLKKEALDPELSIRWVTTGTPWIFVPVQSRAQVDTTPADFAAITALSQKYGAFGLYVFTIEKETDDTMAVWSRCYAPIAGLNEDPVTGSASGALGGYLAEAGILAVSPGDSAAFTTRQGFAGGRGGTARVTVTRKPDGAYDSIAVTGNALILAEGAFTLP